MRKFKREKGLLGCLRQRLDEPLSTEFARILWIAKICCGHCFGLRRSKAQMPACQCTKAYAGMRSIMRYLMQVVMAHIQRLLDAGLPGEHIGVITPYNGQVAMLRELRGDREAAVEISSVDGFQGRHETLQLAGVESGQPHAWVCTCPLSPWLLRNATALQQHWSVRQTVEQATHVSSFHCCLSPHSVTSFSHSSLQQKPPNKSLHLGGSRFHVCLRSP